MNNGHTALTMQDAILTLQNYWSDNGCMITQPLNTEVGAGTANPATALRVIGPEPWSVAYVEPSVRPDDSRYGENPNRLQTHTQFQVILKPDPGNPQELYLGSLQALGVDLRAHDVRFVEDNWASPALGAWGLGWEVWLDGMEITQFTYFQQVGGVSLSPVSVEITYGLERILMNLQGVSHFKDIVYAPGITYGEVFGQNEYEMSRYYLDDADVDTNHRLFEAYAAEARRMLDLELPVPAYTYVLKCSHTFNVLDARGAISTTERAKAFSLMRGLTHESAKLWARRRTALGHPLGVTAAPAPAVRAALPSVPGPETLLFEIGLEELPYADVPATTDAVREVITAKLAATRLRHGAITVLATPRRVVVTVEAVQPREPDTEKTVRGPKVAAAYKDGAPTPALLGFARSQGVDPSALKTVAVGGVEYVAVTRDEPGRTAVEVLSGVLTEVVSGLRSTRNMRWNDPNLSFSRPVRWLLALLGRSPLPVTVSALVAGDTTRVHRTAPDPEVRVTAAEGYAHFLRMYGIMLDRADRRAAVVRGGQELAAEVGGRIDVAGQAGLIDEITDIVEFPHPVRGSFDERYLELPASVLTTVMRKHQRYLPVLDGDRLMPHFVTFANGACDDDVVRAGNEGVLRARYEDAAFFWRADLKVAPEEFRRRLDQLTFEDRLGTVADRADRIAALALDLAARAGLAEGALATVRRAGELAKFDLASQMVVEFSGLAGVMAEEYARRAGEPDEVALALAEMELPRSAGGALPTGDAGAVLSLADRFDLVTGMFVIGAAPTGSSDPFGVRRAAIGLLNVLRRVPAAAGVRVGDGLNAAAARYAAQGVEVPAGRLEEAAELIARRYEQQLTDAGHEHRLVQAVRVWADRPAQGDRTLATLERHVGTEEFGALTAALQRVVRILPGDAQENTADAAATDPVDRNLLSAPAELRLAESAEAVRDALRGREDDLAALIEVSAPLVAAIDAFFDEVLVMDPDPAIRAARLALLTDVARLARTTLDWSAL
ncbi:glycine--tRNA ligase [Streptomyces dysideae]|uniref:Multifunctional fusion protein n=1 Tax=Streptomyces dysideae TaxID=909626 RepID=A0A101V2G4_9ACTN|nr:glycine--tRNA ligase [Streptomyces dysideae]KUO21309.1 glycine--tRNA ligase subunit alpha/beta [Streptomyces dysideae]